MTQYVNGGGNVYMFGGVDGSPGAEGPFLNESLQNFGLEFQTTNSGPGSGGYNGLNSITVTSTHPIFNGLTGQTLKSGNGQDIIDLHTNPNASIIQFQGSDAVYAVVNAPTSIPEPSTVASICIELALGVYRSYKRPKGL